MRTRLTRSAPFRRRRLARSDRKPVAVFRSRPTRRYYRRGKRARGRRLSDPVPGKGAPPRRDRYGSPMESLGAGDAGAEGATNRPAAPPPPHRGVAATWRGWHPLARTFLVLAIAVALGYVALLFTNEFLRGSRVDTWAGPDASVQSGLALAECPAAEGLGDAVFPSWIRYRDEVVAATGRVAPIGPAWQYGQTRYAETDYRMGSIRLLLEASLAVDATPDTVLLLQEPAQGARLYDRIDCA